jgi:Cytochrome c
MTKNYFAALAFCGAIMLISCGGNETSETSSGETPEAPKSMVSDPSSYDPKRGEGKFNAENTTMGALDAAMATKGEAIANTKCFSCHKVSDEKLVGPGWKDVTTRRTPYWILNFITNPDPMIDKDPEVQAQLELCLVRMPNQNLMEGDARQILEFMRKNDGVK